jgi:hypothetical protein
MINYLELKKEFPKLSISWRAQTLTKDGTKAMALAYIDSRDVMQRLDDAVGVGNWKDSFETQGTRVICTISIWDDEKQQWISKSDGAGDTAVEAEKGGLSDAFKRAAVKWGIGRYLYNLEAPWVPCETYNNKFRKFTADPWDFIKKKTNERANVQAPIPEKVMAGYKKILADIPAIHDLLQITETLEGKQYLYLKANYPNLAQEILDALQIKQNELNGVK